MDRMLEVYDALMAASDEHGFGAADVGSYALNSLRMEKAYLTRFELTHDIGPIQAGVERWVRPQKGDFIGRDALEQPVTGNDWRLVYLDVDVPDDAGAADCLGGEAVFLGDRSVGLTTSGGYGFTVDRSLAFAFVSEDAAAAGTELSVLILGEQRTATVLDGPVFDPENTQLLG
jgi:dimethylglycine dehydrogenase